MTRKINEIIIHCAATPNGKPFTAEDIDRWHQERGFHRTNPSFNTKFQAIGYHYVIELDGTCRYGRHDDEIGAHCEGHNARSIGVCMIGTDRFTTAQWEMLRDEVDDLKKKYPEARVLGHRDVPGVKKECPGFNVAAWLAGTLDMTQHTYVEK